MKREGGASKPYAPRPAGEKAPYVRRDDGAKPYVKRDDAAKPYAKRDDAAKPYAKRPEGDRKPYAKPADGERRPYVKREDGPAKPYARRAESGAAPRAEGDAPKPRWKAKDGAPSGERPRSAPGKPFKAAGSKTHGKPVFAKRPPSDPKDTSKRFVPPKKPRA